MWLLRKLGWAVICVVFALAMTGCAKLRDPTTDVPTNVFYYQGQAQKVAVCMKLSGVVTDRCDYEYNALTLIAAEDGKTFVLRCAQTSSGGVGAGMAGAGLMGFIIGQAVDRAMESTPTGDVGGYARFAAAFRDVAPDTLEARLWITKIPMGAEKLRSDLLSSLDKCAGQKKLAGPPPGILPAGTLRPTTGAIVTFEGDSNMPKQTGGTAPSAPDTTAK